MKSFVVTLVIWAALFLLFWFGARELFYPPGDWIGAAVASFFVGLGIGGLRKARLERGDAALVARPEGPPRDGERVAIAGTIEPLDAVLEGPLSGAKCVIYDFEISHIPDQVSVLGETRTNTARRSAQIDRSGMAMAPVVIRSGVRDVRLLAFPGIEGFTFSDLNDGKIARARAYIAATKWEDQSVLNVVSEMKKVTDDRSGSLRVDWKSSSYDNLENCKLSERTVAPGAKACVIGLYSAKDNAIVPQANVGGTRLIQGTRERALELVRDKGTGSIIAAVLLILIPAPVTYGVLSFRERYKEEHQQPSVRGDRMEAFFAAVQKGDLPAVRAGLERGVDVNALNMSGYPALAVAQNAGVATALLDAGAKADRRDKAGYTPLMLQARDGRVDVVRLLLARGADRNAKDPSTQRTALDIAIANGQDEVAKVLK